MSRHHQETANRSRRLGIAAFGMILLVATLALPLFAMAATVRGDDAVTIAAGQTVDDDLVVATNRFVLDGDAAMDVIVVAREVDLNGSVGGSVNAAAGSVSVRGAVDGSVRVVGGTVSVEGTIGGDLVVVGGTATVEPGGTVRGSVTMHGGNLTTQGTIGGDVTGNLERFEIDGPIAGDVSIRAGDVNLESAGSVEGDLSYVSGSEADIASGATVAGTVDRQTIAPWGVDGSFRGRFFSPLVRTLWMLIAGAAVIGLAPRLASALDANMRRPLPAAIIGLIALVAVPVIALLLAISVVGLPVGLILTGAYLAALYLSQYVVGQRVGTLILPDRWNDGSRGYLLLSMTIGVLLLSLLRYLPVPFVGSVIDLAITIVGLGAAVLLLGQLRPRGPALAG
jgi:cytoskeletal protein CcmA (bactofilin family)